VNNREEILKTLKQSREFLSSEFSVKKIAVFGSVARDAITPDSDVDIVVEFSTPIGFRFNRLVKYLENLLGRKVDVLTKDGIRNIRVQKVAENIERDLIYV
jgi:predicted nucleotidyltransferase